MKRCPGRAASDPGWSIYGIDFTSAPRAGKPITIAAGRCENGAFCLEAIHELRTLADYDAWLRAPGPWIGGFDFPFGLPREALRDLGWPMSWPALAAHCTELGRVRMRQVLDEYRATRPVGAKFCYRRGDAAAGAHSPLKLVNPPVALMFLEGACRLYSAEVHVPGMAGGDSNRIAVEAYPGYAVRQLFASRARVSYKNDARAKQTAQHKRVREAIIRMIQTDGLHGVRLQAAAGTLRLLRDDGSGDRLDAVLCALQASWSYERRHKDYGLPGGIDPIEGWIVTVPRSSA